MSSGDSRISLYAEDISQGIEKWIRVVLKEESQVKEVHVDIDSNGTGFGITNVGGIGFRREDLESLGGRQCTSESQSSGRRCDVLGFLSDCSGLVRVHSSNQVGMFDSVVVDFGRGCRLLRIQHGIDDFRKRKQGNCITVRDWGDPVGITGGADVGRAVVGRVRTMVQDVSLTTQNVTFTVYSRRSKRFVFKSLGTQRLDEKAAGFFGRVDPELVVPVECARFQGWTVSGYTVLPPAGHASRSRQRMYFDSVLVESKTLRDAIESLYQKAYQDAVKLLPRRNPGDLLTVRRSLNAYPMFILYINTENKDARKLRVGSASGISDYISTCLVELVESALLQSWQKTLSGRLLRLLEERCRQVEEVPMPSRHVMKREQPPAVEDTRVSLFEDLKNYRCETGEGFQNISMVFPKRRRSSQGREAVEKVLSSWKNPHLMMPHANKESSFFMPVSTLQAHEQKSFTRLNPHEITRQDLSACRIVGQVDRKFVVFVSTSGKLGLVDQHAADERVRLERLQARVFYKDNKPNPASVTSWKVLEKPQIHVGEDEAPLFEEYQEHAYMWGWRWEPWCPSTLRISVTHVPFLCGRLLSPSDLKLYIHQLARTSACNLAPQGVNRVLASVACRGAIMFGDVLEMDQARTLVSSLSRTVQFYECAHGRPTVSSLAQVPLVRTIHQPGEVSDDLCFLKSKLCHHLAHE